MVGEGVGLLGEPGPPAVDDDARRACGAPHAAARRASRCRAPADRRSAIASRELGRERRRPARERPSTGRRSATRRSPVSASRSSGEIGPRSPMTRSTDRSGRALLTVRTGATSTISPPPTVSARPLSRRTNRSPGRSGQRLRDADAHPSGRAGRDRVGADHAQLRGMLTRPDRDGVRAAPRHRRDPSVAEHGQLRVEHARWAPRAGHAPPPSPRVRSRRGRLPTRLTRHGCRADASPTTG